MISLNLLKQRRLQLGYSYQELASLSSLPLSTIQKVFGGITKTPRRKTIETLQSVLFKNESEMMSFIESQFHTGNVFTDYSAPVLRDRPPEHIYSASGATSGHVAPDIKLPFTTYLPKSKKDGEYTLQDYYALPGDYRVELIDGHFFEMSSPYIKHQIVAGSIYHHLLMHISKNHGNCLPLISPVDVQLDKDDKTLVQPDVLVVCDRSKLNQRVVYGAPDFVVEILSPSTRKKDLTLKLAKYTAAGVREYWIIDIDKQLVITYDLCDVDVPAIYPFDTPVPIKIWNNECMIDFSQIAVTLSQWDSAEESN